MKTSDELTTLFRERGLRVTPQRQVIFRLLHGDDAHPTVESLYERAQAAIRRTIGIVLRRPCEEARVEPGLEAGADRGLRGQKPECPMSSRWSSGMGLVNAARSCSPWESIVPARGRRPRHRRRRAR